MYMEIFKRQLDMQVWELRDEFRIHQQEDVI